MKRQRKRWRFFAVYVPCCVAAIVLLLELAVRVFVPAARFWPINNVYQRDGDAGVGYTLRARFDGSAFGARLQTNSRGFRGPEWNVAKAPDTLRIAVIGDSHAFGYGLAYDDTMGMVMARELARATNRRVETLLFAAPGYNARQELAVLERYVLPYAPDLVVIVPTENDDVDAFVADDAGYIWWDDGRMRGAVVDLTIEPLQKRPSWLLLHSRLWLYTRLAIARRRFARENAEAHRLMNEPPRGAFMAAQYEPEAAAPELLTKVRAPLDQMIALAQSRGARVILAPVVISDVWRHLVAELGRAHGAPDVELVATLPRVRSIRDMYARFSLGWDTHFNAEAHRLFGRALAHAAATLLSH
jgi:hypothetical protein